MIRNVTGIAVVAALIWGLSGSADAQTIKLGVIAPLTGGGAAVGIAAAEGTKIAAADYNEKGGLEVGGKKYQIEVIAYDDQYKAADAVAAYNRLLTKDDVRYMVVLTSPSAVALKQNVEDDKVVALTGGFTSEVIGPQTKYMFRIYASALDFMPDFIKWISKNIDGKKIALLNPNDETGWTTVKTAEKAYKENGFNILGSELFERSQKDFLPLVTRITSLGPDIIDIGSTPPATGGLVVRALRELGFKGIIVSTSGGPGWQEPVAIAGKAADGLITVLYADPTSVGFGKIAAKYRTAIGQDPSDIILPVYDAVKVMLRAIQAAGDPNDTSKVRASFAKVLPMDSASGGVLTLGGKATAGADQQIMSPRTIITVKDSKLSILGRTN